MSIDKKPGNSEEIEMQDSEQWDRKMSAPGIKPQSDMKVEDTRKWGATMGPMKRTAKKINYEVEIYKAYGGADYLDDSVNNDQQPVQGGDETAPAGEGQGVAEPFNPSAIPDSKPRTEIARATTAGVNSWWKTYFFLVKGFLGSGVLTLPMGFSNGGALFGVGILAAICAVSILGMLTLLEVRNLEGGSFSDVAYRALGKTGKLVIDISLACCQVYS